MATVLLKTIFNRRLATNISDRPERKPQENWTASSLNGLSFEILPLIILAEELFHTLALESLIRRQDGEHLRYGQLMSGSELQS